MTDVSMSYFFFFKGIKLILTFFWKLARNTLSWSFQREICDLWPGWKCWKVSHRISGWPPLNSMDKCNICWTLQSHIKGRYSDIKTLFFLQFLLLLVNFLSQILKHSYIWTYKNKTMHSMLLNWNMIFFKAIVDTK